MNNDQGYCGFADFPACAADRLASTGLDGGTLLVLAIVVSLVVIVGLAMLVGSRRSR